MTFNDITGQQNIKQQLLNQLDTGRIPHAQLFHGPLGTGKLPMALAYARLLLCENRQGNQPCEKCRNCKMTAIYQHPDLHFVYPIAKKGLRSVSYTSYFKEWNDLILNNPWFDRSDWYEKIDIQNAQPIIYEAQGESLINTLNLTSANKRGIKVVIIWQPELMNATCANKILKTLEEPSGQTIFMLVSERPQRLLPTIISRVQRFKFTPYTDKEIVDAILKRNSLIEPEMAQKIAHSSQGNLIQAFRTLTIDAERATFFDLFVQLMRKAYLRDIITLSKWSDALNEMGREKQKAFLQYCQYFIRENFIYNFHIKEINHETLKEIHFSKNFARFINERNVVGIMEEFQEAEKDIEMNVNSTMVFFDLCMNIIILLIQK